MVEVSLAELECNGVAEENDLQQLDRQFMHDLQVSFTQNDEASEEHDFSTELEHEINQLRVLSIERAKLLSYEQEQQKQLLKFIEKRNNLVIELHCRKREVSHLRAVTARYKLEYERQIDQLNIRFSESEKIHLTQLQQLRTESYEKELRFREEIYELKKRIAQKNALLRKVKASSEDIAVTENNLQLEKRNARFMEFDVPRQEQLRKFGSAKETTLRFEGKMYDSLKRSVSRDACARTGETITTENSGNLVTDQSMDLAVMNTKLMEYEEELQRLVAENDRLVADLYNCRAELQVTKWRTYTTKLRQLKQVKVSDEIMSLISRLKNMSVKIVSQTKKTESIVRNSNGLRIADRSKVLCNDLPGQY